MQDLAQEIAQIRNSFEEYGKHTDDDRILFKRVHIVIDCNLDKKFRRMLHPRLMRAKLCYRHKHQGAMCV